MWHEPQRILSASTLLVFDREGAEILPPAVKINMERIEISSSEIRDNIYIELIKELGYKELADLLEKAEEDIGFWYA